MNRITAVARLYLCATKVTMYVSCTVPMYPNILYTKVLYRGAERLMSQLLNLKQQRCSLYLKQTLGNLMQLD